MRSDRPASWSHSASASPSEKQWTRRGSKKSNMSSWNIRKWEARAIPFLGWQWLRVTSLKSCSQVAGWVPGLRQTKDSTSGCSNCLHTPFSSPRVRRKRLQRCVCYQAPGNTHGGQKGHNSDCMALAWRRQEELNPVGAFTGYGRKGNCACSSLPSHQLSMQRGAVAAGTSTPVQ